MLLKFNPKKCSHYYFSAPIPIAKTILRNFLDLYFIRAFVIKFLEYPFASSSTFACAKKRKHVRDEIKSPVRGGKPRSTHEKKRRGTKKTLRHFEFIIEYRVSMCTIFASALCCVCAIRLDGTIFNFTHSIYTLLLLLFQNGRRTLSYDWDWIR